MVECHQVPAAAPPEILGSGPALLAGGFTPRRPHSSFTEQMSAELASALRGSDLEQIQRLWQQIQDSIREDRFQDQLFAFQRIVSLMEKQLPALKPLVSDNFWATLKDIQTLDAIAF